MTIRERMACCQLFTDHDDHYPEEAEELARARQRGKTLCMVLISVMLKHQCSFEISPEKHLM